MGRVLGMMILLSPAKTFTAVAEPWWADCVTTLPRRAVETEQLVTALGRCAPEELAGVLGVSPKLGDLNAGRYAAWGEAQIGPALGHYHGDVCKGYREGCPLTAAAVTKAQDRVRFLSGLYGLVRPLDDIAPYRLEMKSRWSPVPELKLRAWWGDKLTADLRTDCAAVGASCVVNLASQEYSAVVDLPQIGRPVIDVQLRERRADGSTRIVAVHAKVGRGHLARWLVERVPAGATAEAVREIMQEYDGRGYGYVVEESTADTVVYVR